MDFNAHQSNFAQVGLNLPQNLPSIDLQQHQQQQSNEFYAAHPQVDPYPEHPGQGVPQSQSQVDFAAMKEKINKLMKMENLADITLAGYMIKLLRTRAKMSFRELHDEVSKCYDTLRRSDGSKYTGDLAKALKGCLTSSEIFKEVGENQWGIRDKEAKIYEDKTTKKLKTLINKKKGRSGRKKEAEQGEEAESDDDLSGSDNDEADSIELNKSAAPAKKVKQSPNEYQKAINMLELYSKKVKGAEETADLIKNPFEAINEEETTEEVFKKIGKERFTGILECFDYFYPLIQEYLKLTQGGAGNNSIKVKKEGESGHDNNGKPSKGKK